MPPPDNVYDITNRRRRRRDKHEEQESKKEQILQKYIPDGENILAVKRLTWLMILGEFLKAAGGSLLPVVAAILWVVYLPLWVLYYAASICFTVRWMAKRHKHIHIKPFTTLVVLGVYALAMYALVKTYTRPVLLGSLLIVWVLLWTQYVEKYVTWKESYYILTDRQLWRIYLQIQGIHARWRYPSTDLRAASYSDPEITALYAFLGWVFRVRHVGFFRLGTAVDWDHAGPAAAREGWGSYRHDGGASIVWTMAAPPRQTVDSRVLTGLLAPHPAVHCKRVTIIYRPYAPGDASAVIDSQVRTAQGRNDGKAPQTVQSERAMQSAQEEANGAGLTRFSMIVTSTVRDPTKLGRAGETTMQLGRASRIALRRACASQAATFAAGLGVGVLLNAHTVIPSAIRDYI